MKTILIFEEIGKLMLAFVGSLFFGYAWWVFLVLLLTPDVSMAGYAFNTRVGSILYNIFHHQGMAVLVFLVGFFINLPGLVLTGCILFGHSAMDRIFGYGLKYPDHFKHTHLGWIK